MHEVLIALRSIGPGRVLVATTIAQPQVGRKITHPESLALDMVNHAKRQANCAGVEWEQAIADADGQAALGLVNDLLSPEMYGYSVTPKCATLRAVCWASKGRKGWRHEHHPICCTQACRQGRDCPMRMAPDKETPNHQGGYMPLLHRMREGLKR